MDKDSKKQIASTIEKQFSLDEGKMNTIIEVIHTISLDRGYDIFWIYSKMEEEYFKNAFTWYAPNSQNKDIVVNEFTQAELFQIANQLKDSDYLIIDKSTTETPLMLKLIQKHDITSMMLIALKEEGVLQGIMVLHSRNAEFDTDQITADKIGYYRKCAKMIPLQQLKQEIIPTKEMLQRIYDVSGTIVYTIDCDTKQVTYANRAAIETYPNIEIGSICYETFKDEKKDTPCIFCGCNRVKNIYDSYKTEIYNANTKTWTNYSFSKLKGTTGKNEMLVVLTDTTKQKLYYEQIGTLEFYDSSLEIPNRKALVRDLNNILTLKSSKGVIITTDLDNFKVFNNTFGYEYGDAFLKEVTSFMKNIDKAYNIYRSGGDELTLLLNNAGVEEGKRVANRIQKRFNSEWQINDIEYRGTISIGIVAYPKAGNTTDDLLSKVEFCLSDAKEKGKNQIIVFEKTLGDTISKKNKLTDIIRKGIEKNNFAVYYQPIYNITKQKYVKAEALIRLYHKDFGFISPSEFIPIAEEIGMISTIGFYVLEDVCKKLMTLRMMNTDFECINVNVSTKQLVQKNFVQKFKQMLDKYDIPGNLIQIEITESILISSFDIVSESMAELRQFGITFALDDFGTGYSALSYLTKLRFDTLKIDRSFITAAEHDYHSKIMLKNIINLAKELNMEVVAEGVETDVQLSIISSYRCYNIQGYFFGKPVPASTLLQTFSKKDPELLPGLNQLDSKSIINTFFSETNSKFMFDLFEVISSSSDLFESLEEILEMTGSYLDVSRIYVFESLSYETRKQMEWTSGDKFKPMNVTENLYDYFNDFGQRFDEYGFSSVYKKDLDEKLAKSFGYYRIESMVESLIVSAGKKIGYVGFALDDEHTWSKEELSILYVLSKIFSVIISKVK
jgi:diguanylate cyclase (GGDEF)-like protein